MHYIAYYRQDQKARKLNKHNVRFTQFCPLKPGFIWFKPGLTHWAGQNQFNPGKMPTLPLTGCNITSNVAHFQCWTDHIVLAIDDFDV